MICKTIWRQNKILYNAHQKPCIDLSFIRGFTASLSHLGHPLPMSVLIGWLRTASVQASSLEDVPEGGAQRNVAKMALLQGHTRQRGHKGLLVLGEVISGDKDGGRGAG